MPEHGNADAIYIQPTVRSRVLFVLIVGAIGGGILIGNLYFAVLPLGEIDPALDAGTRIELYLASLFRSGVYHTGLSVLMMFGVVWYGLRVLRSGQYPAPDGPLLLASRITPIRKPWKIVLAMIGLSGLLLMRTVAGWHLYSTLLLSPRCGPECADCCVAPRSSPTRTSGSSQQVTR